MFNDQNKPMFCNDGSTIFGHNNSIFTSQGEQYAVLGGDLYKNGSVIARNVSEEQAKGIVAGFHEGTYF